MLIEDNGEQITFPNEQLKDTPDQELQGFGLFYPLDKNMFLDTTKNLEIHDFTILGQEDG
jgi:hypothetical protein